MKLKIATWNVNSVRARMPVITTWLKKEKPDILCMQELKATEEQYPSEEFSELGYRSAVNGQVRWNGVAIISRPPLSDIQTDLSGYLPEQSRMISAAVAGIRLINAYVPNGGDVDHPRFQEKLRYFEILREYALSYSGPTVILGDFNVAPEPIDTHSPKEQDGSVCYHPLEREQIKLFAEAGFSDVFRRFQPEEQAFSWWDYRAASFRRNKGMRLDLVLANSSADKMITGCLIDREPRGWLKPSDHTPVVFDVETAE